MNSATPNEHRFVTADVFTDVMFGGNQLAVFPDARGLSTGTMQQIAREMNLSETVFVFPPQNTAHTRQLRIFTPGNELPFAGHPTVGAAFVLTSIGAIPLAGDTTRILFEEGVGPVDVIVRSRDGLPIYSELSAAKLPEAGPPAPDLEQIAAVLTLDPAQIAAGHRKPRAFSCGVPFLFVTVRDLAALGSVRLNQGAWDSHLSHYWAPEIYIISEPLDGVAIRARMFAPLMGIPEDPATGSAAAALAGYLAPEHPADGTSRWTVQQGVEMGRPSVLFVEADFRGGAICAVRVGGSSVMVSEGVLKLSR